MIEKYKAILKELFVSLLFGVSTFLVGGACIALLGLIFSLEARSVSVITQFVHYGIIAVALVSIGKFVRVKTGK